MRNLACGFALAMVMVAVGLASASRGEVPEDVAKWLGPQDWERDVDQPVLSLGKQGEFDDTHLLGPKVVKQGELYRMWYCGSQGYAYDVAPTRERDERVYQLGLAESADGKAFTKLSEPRLKLDEPRRSLLTPTFLQDIDGKLVKFQGKYWMWFCSATMGGGGRPHVVQAMTSDDGLQWSEPSHDLLTGAYCPAVIQDGDELRMWFTAPGPYPWVMKHARSSDGLNWTIDPEPVIQQTQAWEHLVFNYPVVHKIDDTYVMWYISYLTADKLKVAIGFAASDDGIHWHKHPDNPVLRPNEDRDWESHYVSSGSVLKMDDGSFRIWYFSRKAPPFKNLYYAVGTAKWAGPGE
jgi:sucrose-6-phosphate hydrolase SacC (GH32 family)